MELLFLLGIPLIVALIGFAYYIYQDGADRAARREIMLTRFRPDGLGNYPVYYNPKNGEYFFTRPGNPAYPAEYNYLLDIASPNGGLKKTTFRQEMKCYKNGQSLDDTDQAEKLEAGPQAAEMLEAGPQAAERPELTEKQEKLLLLSDAKMNRVAKTRAIKEICGYSPGGSPEYAAWSRAWDNL